MSVLGPGPLVQIGEVAERTGLSLRTIRYYEEVGLVVPAGRSPGGFRLYCGADVERLRLIMRMKPLGFSLEEMSELLDALAEWDRGAPTPALRAQLRAFRDAADVRVAGLREQLAVAEGLAAVLHRRCAEH